MGLFDEHFAFEDIFWPKEPKKNDLFGSPMTKDYYGHRSEFRNNDSILAHLEDMQQMSTLEGFNAEEQGYDWDEIMDAKADGYIPGDDF